MKAAAIAAAAAGAALTAYLGYYSWSVTQAFEQRRWDLPAKVYAAPLELYAGRSMTPQALQTELERLGYGEPERGRTLRAGTFRAAGRHVELVSRAFEFADGAQAPAALRIEFEAGAIAGVTDAADAPVALARLDPLLIGSIFPAHGEDRLILAPEDIPPLLTDALKAVEDRRFDSHHGIDLRAIVRATLVNLSEGEIRQGASTLTQQLVRSYFLTNEQTFWRKLREAAMAIVLELRYDKPELLHAYVNEVYVAQDGARAIHGFGLASQYFFARPATDLELHELALLVALVRGPSHYDPRRFPERALERRELVLRQMAEYGAITPEAAARASARPLGLRDPATRGAGYHAAFLDLVRRQLRTDYPDDVLTRRGLKVFTSLEPLTQAAAETTLTAGIARLDDGGAVPPDTVLEGAAVVTSPHTAEVLALVGGRRAHFDGFNRALDARRQVGSLLKPAVYLAALESGRYTLASLVDDAPIDVALPNGDVWSPRNYSDETHGSVPLVRALADSLNLATVRLGLDVGVAEVAGLLARLGLDRTPAAYPSLLLGSLDLTPFEVAQLYNSLANGGFRVPLRAVRSVVDERGQLQHYPIEIGAAADPTAVHQINAALAAVLSHGTGRLARQRLPAGLRVAGKTGTSDGLRDSWFAGFGGDRLLVVWLGADDNRPVGLTGGTGAATIWAELMSELDARSFAPSTPPALRTAWLDYRSGAASAARCDGAVAVPLPASARRPAGFACGGKPSLGTRLRHWLGGFGQ